MIKNIRKSDAYVGIQKKHQDECGQRFLVYHIIYHVDSFKTKKEERK
jgi:hypothetical protein